VEAIKAGALDYVVKSAEAFATMPRTVERALREWKLLTERREAVAAQKRLIAQLEEALSKVKTLSGLLPICSACKKIRDDQGYWSQVEGYIQEHTDARFTHSYCPECARSISRNWRGASPTPNEDINQHTAPGSGRHLACRSRRHPAARWLVINRSPPTKNKPSL